MDKISPGLANMLLRMYEAWEDNDRPFFPTASDCRELEAFCTREPEPYTLPDDGIPLVFNVFNGGDE